MGSTVWLTLGDTVCTYCRHRATLIWSHVCVHLINTHPIFALLQLWFLLIPYKEGCFCICSMFHYVHHLVTGIIGEKLDGAGLVVFSFEQLFFCVWKWGWLQRAGKPTETTCVTFYFIYLFIALIWRATVKGFCHPDSWKGLAAVRRGVPFQNVL